MGECLEDYDLGHNSIFCHLPADHRGLHYDKYKNISWKEGPDDVDHG